MSRGPRLRRVSDPEGDHTGRKTRPQGAGAARLLLRVWLDDSQHLLFHHRGSPGALKMSAPQLSEIRAEIASFRSNWRRS